MRVLRGTVETNGTIKAGTGFTAAKVSKGLVEITYTEAFGAAPTVTCDALGSRSAAAPSTSAAGSCRLLLFNPSTTLEEEGTIAFTIVGGALRKGAALLPIGVSLSAAGVRHGLRKGSATLPISVNLTAAGKRIRVRRGAALLPISVNLTAAGIRHRRLAGAAALPISVSLSAAGKHVVVHRGAALLPVGVLIIASGQRAQPVQALLFTLEGEIEYERIPL